MKSEKSQNPEIDEIRLVSHSVSNAPIPKVLQEMFDEIVQELNNVRNGVPPQESESEEIRLVSYVSSKDKLS